MNTGLREITTIDSVEVSHGPQLENVNVFFPILSRRIIVVAELSYISSPAHDAISRDSPLIQVRRNMQGHRRTDNVDSRTRKITQRSFVSLGRVL